MAPEITLKGLNRRIEWISLVYLVFFVLAVMTPSIVTSDFFGIPQQHVEEIFIFLFGLGGLAAFIIYERLMERRTRERDEAVQSAERSMKELVESYRYIGSVNRQMDVLKKHINQTSVELTGKQAYWKDLLHSLAANAAACANARRVLIRFVELDKLRTDREVYHHLEGNRMIKVSNRELKDIHDAGVPHSMIAQDGERILVVPSDKRDTAIKAYLLFELDSTQADSFDIPLVKVFANQAELIYHNLIRQNGGNSGGGKGKSSNEGPLDSLKKVTSSVIGQVR